MMNDSLVSKEENDLIDSVEVDMVNNFDPIKFDLRHSFLPGFYIRTIYMPAGSRLTSQIHRTEHPFRISMGKLIVYNKGEATYIEAPYDGVTTPGTRRIIRILEDTVWSSLHAIPAITGDEENYSDEDKAEVVDAIEKLLSEQRVNPLLGIPYSELTDNKKISHA
jgi:hypothetical protein